jgi:hypothetical protein
MLHIGFVLRWLRTLFAFACLFAVSTAGADCDAAAPLSLPGQWRGAGGAGDEAQVLRFEVPSAAIVALEVTAALAAPTEPSLTVVEDCGAARDLAPFAYLESAATRQVLAVRGPGEVFVAVRAQDPEESLDLYTVTARIGGWPESLGDPGEEEVDPDPFAGSRPGRLGGLCGSGVADDHADDVTCATPLVFTGRMTGEIRNDWRDDEDVFTFVVAELRTVVIETAGDTDTAGALYDRHAQRLAADDDGGSGDNFRIVKTLVPGRYFVRVEGSQRAEGPYRLSLRELKPR